MSTVKNAIHHDCFPIGIDGRIKSKIEIISTIQIDIGIGDLFTAAFTALAGQLEDEKKDAPEFACMLLGTDELTVVIDEDEAGRNLRLCIYPVYKWLKEEYDDIFILAIIIEELCHCIWMIDDEHLVVYKVLEIIRRLDDKFTLDDLTRMGWNRDNG